MFCVTHARIPEVQQRCSPTCSQEKLTPLGGGLVGLCEVRPSRSHELLHQDAALAKVWALASGNRLRALSRLPRSRPAPTADPAPVEFIGTRGLSRLRTAYGTGPSFGWGLR